MAAEDSGAGKAWVPAWNGDPEKYLSYRFEQKLYIKGVKKTDRYICGPSLVRALGV